MALSDEKTTTFVANNSTIDANNRLDDANNSTFVANNRLDDANNSTIDASSRLDDNNNTSIGDECCAIFITRLSFLLKKAKRMQKYDKKYEYSSLNTYLCANKLGKR